jgi:hypothetical protein
MMNEFLSPKGKYQPPRAHMVDNVALCDWASIGQEQLHIVHDHFLHYLDQC